MFCTVICIGWTKKLDCFLKYTGWLRKSKLLYCVNSLLFFEPFCITSECESEKVVQCIKLFIFFIRSKTDVLKSLHLNILCKFRKKT